MIVITAREKFVNAFWWVVSVMITEYLFFGVVNTIDVLSR